MDNENEFKDLLNNSLNQKEFSFQQEDWLKAKAYIDKKRNRKKRGFVFFTSSLVLLLGIGTYLLLPTHTSNAHLSENKSTKTLKPNNKNINTTKNVNEIITPNQNKSKTNSKLILNNNTNNIANNNPQIANTTQVISKNILSKNNLTIISKPTGSIIMNGALVTVKDTKQKITPNTSTKTNEVENNTDKNLPEVLLPNYTIINNLFKNDTIQNVDILNLPFATVINLGVDSSINLQVQNNIPKNNVPKNGFVLEAGTNYLLGWKNGNLKEANGFNAIIGINYYNFFTTKLGVLIGLQYSTMGNFNTTNYTTKVTRFKFGEESDVTTFATTKLYYLTAPIKFDFKINQNNSVGIGYNIAYLLNSKSKITTYTERVNFQSEQQVSTAHGYTSGFNKFDNQLSIYYKKRIYKELFINSEFFMGTRDIKNNTTFNTNVFERNLGFKITLHYNLFKI